eukprot:COSAG05_NODE_735_length_7640_cov_6.045883_3_plen_67_part_00
MQHLSGEYYDGQWQDNVPHGHGRATHANGVSYEGEWRSGIPHGRGTSIDGGISRSGFWDNGVFKGH